MGTLVVWKQRLMQAAADGVERLCLEATAEPDYGTQYLGT